MPRILIVDDDEAIRRLVRLNLTDLYEAFPIKASDDPLGIRQTVGTLMPDVC